MDCRRLCDKVSSHSDDQPDGGLPSCSSSRTPTLGRFPSPAGYLLQTAEIVLHDTAENLINNPLMQKGVFGRCLKFCQTPGKNFISRVRRIALMFKVMTHNKSENAVFVFRQSLSRSPVSQGLQIIWTPGAPSDDFLQLVKRELKTFFRRDG